MDRQLYQQPARRVAKIWGSGMVDLDMRGVDWNVILYVMCPWARCVLQGSKPYGKNEGSDSSPWNDSRHLQHHGLIFSGNYDVRITLLDCNVRENYIKTALTLPLPMVFDWERITGRPPHKFTAASWNSFLSPTHLL